MIELIKPVMFSNIREVEEWIDINFNSISTSNLEKTKKLLEPVCTNEQLIILLKSLLNDQEKLAEIASKSYTHANGFDKIVLIENYEVGYRLRLHIWRPDHVLFHAEHVHNHPWDFSSKVLTGALTFKTYKLNELFGEELYHYRTLPLPSGEVGHQLKDLGRENLNWVFDATIEAGSFYTLSKEVIHRVIKESDRLTSTIMLQTPIEGIVSDLFTEEPYKDEKEFVHKFYDVNTLVNLLHVMIDELSKNTK
ncbi:MULTISPECIES: hypothetical protein [Bacillus]|uniref:hypothetical protein n=1 Tax=Bacillus TaxID=1386 RepID=UPI000D7C5B56|nr:MULTISPECIES: hypothetical protein [Bacillus]MDA1656354.1 hypothetical protein [Bacillus cereus group sp. TH150LC]